MSKLVATALRGVKAGPCVCRRGVAPLVKIKQAITRTRHEALQMDIRIGLLQHILLRQTLSAKLQLRDTVAATGY